MRSHKSHKTWHFICSFYRCKRLIINVFNRLYATACNRIYYILYIGYIHTNVFIYPIHIIYNFFSSKRERFFVLELGVEMVVKRLRLVAVDVINNLAHCIVNSFRSVGDVVVGHVRPGVPEAKGNSFARYLKFRAD